MTQGILMMNGARLKAILEHVADGIVFVDAENRVEFVNEHASGMLGLTGDVTGNDGSSLFCMGNTGTRAAK